MHIIQACLHIWVYNFLGQRLIFEYDWGLLRFNTSLCDVNFKVYINNGLLYCVSMSVRVVGWVGVLVSRL